MIISLCKCCHKTLYSKDSPKLICQRCLTKNLIIERDKKLDKLLSNNPLKWLNKTMKKLFYITCTILTITSCKNKEWNYEIHSETIIDGKTKKCIFYTDSVSITDSTISYLNSDGSKVTIKEPYILIDRTHNK